MKFFPTLFLFLFIVFFVEASTYYVSVTGNNSQIGSQSHPWETLQYAADNVSPGDTVIVPAGEYAGFYMDKSGEADNPIVFKAENDAVINSPNGTTADGINLEGADYIVIDGFAILNPSGTITRAGIRSVINTGVVIKNNIVDGMGYWGIFTGFSENITIENNSCSNSIQEHGIYHSNSADNPAIRGNICYSNHGNGIHMNGDESMGGDGIISNALVEGNIIYDNGEGGGSGINCDGVRNSIIMNNLLYNNHASGISLYKIDGAEPAMNNVVVNNTIIMASDGRWAINIKNGSTGNTIVNNVLFNNHSWHGGIASDAASLTGLTSDYNVVVDAFSMDGDETAISLNQWKSQTGQDMNSIASSPGEIFVDPANDNYDLIAGCDAVDKGANTNAPSTDIRGVPRPQGTGIDIGAYEYTTLPLAVSGYDLQQNFKIIPNPVNDECMFKSETPVKNIEVIDLKGNILKIINGNNTNNITISLSSLPTGIYYIRGFYMDNKHFTQTIIKQ